MNLSQGASRKMFSSEIEYSNSGKGPGDSFVGMHCIFDQFKSSG